MSVTKVDAAESNEAGPQRALAIRFGTFMLAPREEVEIKELVERVGENLNADYRVKQAEVPELDAHGDEFLRRFPVSQTDEPLMEDKRNVLELVNPFTFRVSVPIKNQRTFHAGDEVPTDLYECCWDGQSITVAWPIDAASGIPRSGGHVVEEVLRDLADKTDCDLIVQACSPGCTYLFAHTTLRVTATDNSEAAVQRADDDRFVVNLEYPHKNDWLPSELSSEIFYEIRRVLRTFSHLKNDGLHLLELEGEARGDLDNLIGVQHHQLSEHRAASALAHPIRHLKHRRSIKADVSRLWLAISRMQILQRTWSYTLTSFESRAEDFGLLPLFDNERSDEPLIRDLNLDLIRSALEDSSRRMDSSSLVAATVAAGVTGAGIGAVAAILLER